jgi:hypothetical protein
MNQHILEKLQIVSAILPLDLQTARVSDIVSMKNYGRCAVVIFKGVGTAGDDPTYTLEQCTDVTNSQSDAKALNFTRYDMKQGTQTGIGTFTTTTQAAGNTITNLTLAESENVCVIDILAEDLDVENGFDCVRLSISDVGTNAQLGCALFLLHEPRYASGTLPSAIGN